jgi:hypothetical protein
MHATIILDERVIIERMQAIISFIFVNIWIIGLGLAISGFIVALQHAGSMGGFRRALGLRSVQALLNLGGACLCIWMAGISGPGSMRTVFLALMAMFIFLAFLPARSSV